MPDRSPQDAQKLLAAKPLAIGRWPCVGSHSNTDQEDAMMNGYGMGWGMGFGGLWPGVGLLVVVLTIADLIKYLRK